MNDDKMDPIMREANRFAPPPEYGSLLHPEQPALPVGRLIVGFLLLTSCGLAAVGVSAVGLDAAADRAAGFLADVVPDPEAERLAEWEAFSPAIGVVNGVAPDERQGRIAEEAVEALIDGFDVDEVSVVPGRYDEAARTYYADYYLVRLRAEDDPSTMLAWSFSGSLREAVEAGVEWSEDGLVEGQFLEELDDGTFVLYTTAEFEPLFDGPTPHAYIDMLGVVAADWPGGVITRATWDIFEDSSDVYPTTWEQFLDAEPFDGYEASYALYDQGVWELDDWSRYGY